MATRPAPPALWIAPDWERIEKKDSPAAQYRHAQVQAGGPERPGGLGRRLGATSRATRSGPPSRTPRSPGSCSWGATETGSDAFANVLKANHYGRNEVLTQVMVAGIAELEGDAEKVLGYFDNNGFTVVENFLDPAIVDFALEIILRLKDDRPALSA